MSTELARTGELQADQPAHDGGTEQERGILTRRLLLLHARAALAQSEGTPACLCSGRVAVGGRGHDRSAQRRQPGQSRLVRDDERKGT